MMGIGTMIPLLAGAMLLPLGILAGRRDVDPGSARSEAQLVRGLVAESGLPTTLRECEVTAARLPQLAREAAEQWTANFNPRPVDVPALEELYRCAMSSE